MTLDAREDESNTANPRISSQRIAVFSGDGIGPDVIRQALNVLHQVQATDDNLDLKFVELDWGVSRWQRTGKVVPDDFLDTLKDFDAILLGAVGWPDLLPDHATLKPLIEIRQTFDQYACVRPARLLPGLDCVLSGKGPDEIDLVVIRENSEGEYVNVGGRVKRGQPDEYAVQTALHTRPGIERVLRYGFKMARQRRKHLTMATKSNAQQFAYGLWDYVLEELRDEYPDVEATRQHCDAAVMNLVRCPERFDVIVASNLFGDLLTDLGGILAGGLGLVPSANINPEGHFPSMFEPVHGSAPDIAGQGIANPIAAISSAAMMLEHLNCTDAASRIQSAVQRALAEGCKTPDLGGDLTTEQMGQQVIRRLADR